LPSISKKGKKGNKFRKDAKARGGQRNIQKLVEVIGTRC
jgi:hypothetical protein